MGPINHWLNLTSTTSSRRCLHLEMHPSRGARGWHGVTRRKLDGTCSIPPPPPPAGMWPCDRQRLQQPVGLRELVTGAGRGTYRSSSPSPTTTHGEPPAPPSVRPSSQPSLARSASSLAPSSLAMDCSVATSKTFLFFLSMVFWVSQKEVLCTCREIHSQQTKFNLECWNRKEREEKVCPLSWTGPEWKIRVSPELAACSKIRKPTPEVGLPFFLLLSFSKLTWVVFIAAKLVTKCISRVVCVLSQR